ncbi:MAG: iron ABC transporter substrate-binding protein [Neisseriaceae bacterium]|nr:iron ABC transporter substrate-binding protein [Neisseriaceae bacterium]
MPRRLFLRTVAIAALALLLPMSAVAASKPLLYVYGAVPSPKAIKRVISAGGPSDVLLLSLAPEKMLGLASANTDPKRRAYFSPAVAKLPTLGRLSGRGSTLPLEKLIALKPDVIIDVGNVTAAYRSQAQRLAQQTQIPYVLVDGRLADAPQQLRELGKLLGVADRGNALAAMAETILKQARQNAAAQAGKPALKVYFGRGVDGLETGLAGSIHTEALEYVGATNVAQAGGKKILTRVSMEQLLLWQPDVVLTQDPKFYQSLHQNKAWQGVKAVKNKRVYLVPSLPYGWLDGPPSINRLLGLIWLQKTVYPGASSRDAAAQIKRYFKLFYGHDLATGQF